MEETSSATSSIDTTQSCIYPSSSGNYYEDYQPNHSKVLSIEAASSDQLPVATVQQDANPEVQATSTNGERRCELLLSDSAYNSEHEDTPEQSEAAPAQASDRKITATLLDEELWKSFNKIGNEMIVTKPGRRLFPSLLVTLKGLESSQEYNITLKVAPADPYRYKFFNLQWSMVGDSEVNQNEARQLYLHSNSPNMGSFWMKKPISFRSVKITHNPHSKNGNILLHTMHKYVLEIIISPTNNSGDTVITLDETTFVAVSAYQNTSLTQLKIDNNPFAKGFRDRLRAVAYQPQVQSCSFDSEMPFYREGYKTQVLGQHTEQLQSAAQLQLQPAQTLPVQPFLGIGCTQASTITATAESIFPVPGLGPMVPSLPSYGNSVPSQLTTLYSNHGYSFYPQPPIGGLNLPSSSPQ